MKFSKLKLLVAIDRLKPRGDPVTDKARMRLAMAVRNAYTDMWQDVNFPWSVSEVVELCVAYRKQPSLRTKAQIAAIHGTDCFWKHREKGPCSDDVEGGHVVPRANGAGELTVANGMIECRAHNNQRRARSIEEYLDSQDTTS